MSPSATYDACDEAVAAVPAQRLELLDKIDDLCGMVHDSLSEESMRARMGEMFLRLSDSAE